MRLLPVGITVFLWSFPAGLFVYWITSNLVTLAQNYVIYNFLPGRKSSENGAARTGRSGAQGKGTGGAEKPKQSRGDSEKVGSQTTPQDAAAKKAAKRKRRKKKK
jgi:YidC/Oxa1 family membrane protein insertase